MIASLLFLVWIYGVCKANIWLTDNFNLNKFPVVVASLLWPVAVAVAIVRIIINPYTEKEHE